MAPDIPKTATQWAVSSTDGKDGFNALKLSEQPVAAPGDSQVLVKLHAASLNFRDIIIPLGQYPFGAKTNVVPGSDGAGTVIAVGKAVTRWKPGDKVVTLFNQAHIGGGLTPEIMGTGLGGVLDGTLRSVGAFSEHGLVRQPEGLSALEASTLTCAGVTAWNALYGSADHQIKPGQWVLTQGTGGVSIFAVQFAKAAGARVVATTSSADKAKLLQRLGADHIINYNDTPEWGAEAKRLTGGGGVDHVVDVVGGPLMKQSLASVRLGGIISVIGFVGASTPGEQPSLQDCLSHQCVARGIMVGSRALMEDMCRAIEANPDKLRPVVDPKVFKLEDLKAAYEYQLAGKHQAKVCIEIA